MRASLFARGHALIPVPSPPQNAGFRYQRARAGQGTSRLELARLASAATARFRPRRHASRRGRRVFSQQSRVSRVDSRFSGWRSPLSRATLRSRLTLLERSSSRDSRLHRSCFVFSLAVADVRLTSLSSPFSPFSSSSLRLRQSSFKGRSARATRLAPRRLSGTAGLEMAPPRRSP